MGSVRPASMARSDFGNGRRGFRRLPGEPRHDARRAKGSRTTRSSARSRPLLVQPQGTTPGAGDTVRSLPPTAASAHLGPSPSASHSSDPPTARRACRSGVAWRRATGVVGKAPCGCDIEVLDNGVARANRRAGRGLPERPMSTPCMTERLHVVGTSWSAPTPRTSRRSRP